MSCFTYTEYSSFLEVKMLKPHHLLVAILVLPSITSFAEDKKSSLDAAIGGGIGGAVGAVIGNEVLGSDGAVIGGAIGGAVGTAATTDGRIKLESEHNHSSDSFCPPGQAKKGRC
jgi:hypothetical protein